MPILVTYIILSTNYTSIKMKTDGKKKKKTDVGLISVWT